MENCLGFGVKHFFFFFAGVSPLSPGRPIAVGSAFPVHSISCTLVNLFLTFNFKSLTKAELGKCKSRFACRNGHMWTCVCVCGQNILFAYLYLSLGFLSIFPASV